MMMMKKTKKEKNGDCNDYDEGRKNSIGGTGKDVLLKYLEGEMEQQCDQEEGKEEEGRTIVIRRKKRRRIMTRGGRRVVIRRRRNRREAV